MCSLATTWCAGAVSCLMRCLCVQPGNNMMCRNCVMFNEMSVCAAWQQHDVQELCRVMFDALEKKWANTDQSDLINHLYQGKMKDYVKCLEVITCSTTKKAIPLVRNTLHFLQKISFLICFTFVSVSP